MTRQSQPVVTMQSWIIWGIGALCFFYDYAQQISPNALAPQLAQTFQTNAKQLGILIGVYFLSYAVMQIPIGLIVDRFGVRRPLAIAVFASALGNLGFALSHNLEQASMSRLLMGLTAFSYVSCLKLASNWFPSAQFATLVGLTNVIGMVGGIGATAPLAMLTHQIGWRGTIGLFAGMGFCLAVLVFGVIRDRPSTSPGSSTLNFTPGEIWTDLRAITQNRQFWYMGLYGACLNAGFPVIAGLWGAAFIRQAYTLDQVTASNAISTILYGGIVGSFFFGWISDRLKRRKPPLILAAIGMLSSLFLLIHLAGHVPLWVAMLFMGGFGFFCGGNVLAYAVANDHQIPGGEGIATGFINTCVIGGAAIFTTLIGWTLDLSQQVSGSGDLQNLTVDHYRFVFAGVIVLFASSLGMAVLVREPRRG